MKRHNTKEQAKFIITAFMYVISNWKSILVVWGSIAAIVTTLGTFILNNVLIPSAKPVVRPIFDRRYEVKISPVNKKIDSLETRVIKLEENFKLFLHPD